MSHLYPLAETAREALDTGRPMARTRFDAERLANGTPVTKLATEWISEAEGDVDLAEVQASTGLSQGFIQAYEDEAGRPVYAVTYWQLDGPVGAGTTAPAPETAPAGKAGPATPATPVEDHTDDLYFRARRTRKRARKPHVDPRQMDLFARPDGRGYEHTEGGAVINDEEGDGTTFGG